MLPIVQLDLREAPYVPPSLRDLELVAVFFGRGDLPSETENGNGWLVRAYADAGALCALDAPEQVHHAVSEWTGSGQPIRPRPIACRVLERDFPDWDDVAFEVPDEFSDAWEDDFGAANGCKLGGWPSLIQSTIFWAPNNEHSANPEFVLQIESIPKANRHLTHRRRTGGDRASEDGVDVGNVHGEVQWRAAQGLRSERIHRRILAADHDQRIADRHLGVHHATFAVEVPHRLAAAERFGKERQRGGTIVDDQVGVEAVISARDAGLGIVHRHAAPAAAGSSSSRCSRRTGRTAAQRITAPRNQAAPGTPRATPIANAVV
jgi:hypothetical protein